MAIGNVNVRVEVRACYVNHKKALFHGWFNYSQIVPPSLMVGGHNGGTISSPIGLVEFENGKVDMVNPTAIRFADGGEFGDICFAPEEILDVIDDPDKRKEIRENYGNDR